MFLLALSGLFGWYLWEEIEFYQGREDQGSLYSFVIKKISELGGLIVVLYLAMWILVRACTRNKMENYLVSELYAYQNKQTQSYNPDKKVIENDVLLRKDSQMRVR